MLSCLSISSSTIKDKDNFSWSDHFTWTTDLNLLAFVCLVLVFFTLCLKHSYVKSICNSRAYPKDVSSRGTRRKSITLSKWCILLSWTVLMCKVFFLVLMLEKTRLITNATPTYFFFYYFFFLWTVLFFFFGGFVYCCWIKLVYKWQMFVWFIQIVHFTMKKPPNILDTKYCLLLLYLQIFLIHIT